MDMKKILQAMDGASTKPVEGSNSMAKFLRVVNEAEKIEAIFDPGMTPLKMSLNSKDVAAWQWALNKLSYDIGPDGVDKKFGPNTDTATRQFQKDNSTTVDGIAGPRTLSVMNSILAKKGITEIPGYKNTKLDVKPGPAEKDKKKEPKSASKTMPNAVQGKQVFDHMKQAGFSDVQSAAWVGCIYGESQFNPNAQGKEINPKTGETYFSHGIVQWNLDRFKKLQQFSKKIEGDINKWKNNLKLQLRYLEWELQNKFSHVVQKLKGTEGDIEKSLYIMIKHFEMPADIPGEFKKRLPIAKAALAEFTNQTASNDDIPPLAEGKKGSGLIKHYFESVQTEAEQAFDQRRAKIKEQARRIAQRMREDAKVSAVDPAKKTITYTDDKTGISTTIPQAMAKPGEGGQVMVDKSQVNQAVGQDQQQPQAVKVGDMIKMMDTESSSAGVRMQRALQREKEKREFSQRYAEKNFPIGKKPEPIKEPQKDQPAAENDTHQIKGNELIEYLMKRFDMTREQAIELLKKKGLAENDSGAKYKVRSIGKDKKGEYYVSPSTGEKVYKKAKVGDHEVPGSKEIKSKVAEGNEDPAWMKNLRLRK